MILGRKFAKLDEKGLWSVLSVFCGHNWVS
jgi:hypothetical protein